MVGLQCREDALQGLDVVAQEAAAFIPQGVHGGGFGVAELSEGEGDFFEHFECPRAVVDGYGESFDVEAVEQGGLRRGQRFAVEDFADQSRMQGQRVDVGNGFGQLFGGDVFNRADVEALVNHTVRGGVVYAFASDKRGDGLAQSGAVVGGGFGGEVV